MHFIQEMTRGGFVVEDHLITDYRHSLIYQIIESRNLSRRQIDAAMASACLIDCSPKLASPGGVVKADPSIKGHPVIHMAFIFVGPICFFCPPENPVFFLVGQAVNSSRRVILL